MRRFLTGYAVSYKFAHRRHGHVLQNRYKSIVCEADSYFTELVRYIHLNQLRVKLVTDLKELERYPYCGDGAILGAVKNDGKTAKVVRAEAARKLVEEHGETIAEVAPAGGVSTSGISRPWAAVIPASQQRP